MPKARRQSNETVDTKLAALEALPAVLSNLATTSGTAIDFSAIPSTAKRITLAFNNLSCNGTPPFIVQLGTAAGLVTSGYTSNFSAASNAATVAGASTAGFGFWNGNTLDIHSCIMTLINLGGNQWAYMVAGGFTNGTNQYGHSAGGFVSLGAALTRLRLTTTTGAAAFDGGSMSILWE